MCRTFDPSSLNSLPQYAEPIWRSKLVLFSNGWYISFGTFWKSVKPSGSSGGQLQRKMHAWYTLQHDFMQGRGTWPSGRTLFNTGGDMELGMGRQRGQERPDCCKNRSLWRVDPLYAQITFCTPHAWTGIFKTCFDKGLETSYSLLFLNDWLMFASWQIMIAWVHFHQVSDGDAYQRPLLLCSSGNDWVHWETKTNKLVF